MRLPCLRSHRNGARSAFAARRVPNTREGKRPIPSRLKAAKMTPAQIDEAQRMARERKPK